MKSKFCQFIRGNVIPAMLQDSSCRHTLDGYILQDFRERMRFYILTTD